MKTGGNVSGLGVVRSSWLGFRVQGSEFRAYLNPKNQNDSLLVRVLIRTTKKVLHWRV